MKKNNRKLFALLLSVGLLTGCGSAASGTPDAEGNKAESDVQETAVGEKEFCDEAFLSDFSEAIQARWQVNDKHTESGDERDRSSVLECVDAELNVIGPKDYRNQKFEDEHLQEEAVTYLDAIEKQKEILESETTEEMPADKNEEFDELGNVRYEIIVDLYDNYGLKIEPKHMETMNKARNYYYINQYGDEEFFKMLNSAETYPLDDASGEKGECFDLTNETPYDLKSLDLYLYLCKLNEAGDNYEVVGIIKEQRLPEWKSGEVITFTILEEDVKKYDVSMEEDFPIVMGWQ